MSIAQLEQEIATLKASLGALEAAKDAANQEIRRLGEEKAELRAASQRQLAGGDTAGHAALRSQEARLDEVIGEAYSGPAFKNLEAAQSKIRSLESQLYQAQQKAKFEAEKNTPVVASPAPVPPEDTGTVPPEGGANANTPPPPAPGASPPASTQLNKANDDNSQTANQGGTNPANSTNTPKENAIKQGNLNADGAIEPQPNILDRFASYTYSASVYLMSTRQYTRLLRSKKKNINGYNLLFQSGGAPTNVGGFLGKGTGSVNSQDPGAEFAQEFNDQDYGRNPAFPQDFYIDSITIDNALPGRQTQAAHMVTNLKFTVIEPGNISLLDRLYAAVQDMGQTAGENQPINYTATAYLMVIRWYGYDANGNLVKVGALDPATGLTDPNAVVEKFIPFIIKKINWSVGSKLVSYEFDCAPINQMVAGGTRRGTVPYDIQLTATSVGELLGGNAVYSSGNAPASSPGQSTSNQSSAETARLARQGNPPGQAQQRVPDRPTQASVRAVDNAIDATGAPPKANAAKDRKIIKLGLMGAMNEFQQTLVTPDKIYRKADTYEIVFVPGKDGKQNIRDAQIRLPGAVVSQDQTSMGTAASQNAAQAFSPETNALNISSRNWSVTAGMQVVQAIDLAIRNSSYIYDQALTTNNEDGTETLNSARTKPLRWFKINMEAEQGEYDTFRNDYAYKIRFIISEYEVPNFDSKYFPVSKFRGVHKSYPFWFTGQNTAVLDFQANFNGLYNITVTGATPNDSQAAKIREQFTSSMREIPKYTYMAASSESRQGSAEQGNEIPSNASEVLYSPSDMAKTKVRIIGDPAWIQQGDLAGGVSVTEFSYSPFLPDGTINFDANQVMFEISWQRPQDYNIATGLADPYKGAGLEARLPLQSTVYQATKIISEFRQGKFEQTIEGSMYFFPIPSKTNTAAATAVNNQSNAETARLAAGAAKATSNRAAADNNALAASFANQTAAVESRLGRPNTSTAGAGRGSTSAYAALLPGGAGGGRGFVNQLNNSARAAAGVPAPNTNSASAPPPPPPPGFPIGPLPPALPPISNGVIVGPAAQILGPTVAGRLRQLDRLVPQKGARDN